MATQDAKTRIPDELAKFAPFFHDIDLGGGYNTAPDTRRMREMENWYFPVICGLNGGNLKGKRVLDVGCNCGGFAFAAARLGAKEVVGIDSDPENITKANAVREYLKTENVRFEVRRLEDMSTNESFDVTIMAGIMYHLSDPLGGLEKVARITKSMMVVDSHVHYSANSSEEDRAMWWMLPDTDQNDLDGLFADDLETAEKYLQFEASRPVDYSKLTNQFVPSPQSQRDMDFVKENIAHADGEVRVECNIGSVKPGQLVLVPNKKALVKALRHNGFEDVAELIPQRFASIPYLGKFRVGLVAMKRDPEGPFAVSIQHQKLGEVD